MRGKNRYILVFLLICLRAFSQAPDASHALIRDQNYRFLLNNEEVITGTVIDEDKDFVIVEKRPSLATVEIRKSTIITAKRISIQESLTEDPLGENPHADMYLVSSSVLPFKRGCFSTTAHWFLFDQIQYAFTENLSVYVTSLAFLPCGTGVKLSKQINELTFIGADLSGMMQLGQQDVGSQVLGYMAQAKLTHGTTNRNLTLGVGAMGINPNAIGQVNAGEVLVNSLVISAGFCNRFTERWAIVMDGYYLTEESFLFGGFAFRFLRDEQIAWCFGAYSHVNDIGGPKAAGKSPFSVPIPYLSYSRKFSY